MELDFFIIRRALPGVRRLAGLVVGDVDSLRGFVYIDQVQLSCQLRLADEGILIGKTQFSQLLLGEAALLGVQEISQD